MNKNINESINNILNHINNNNDDNDNLDIINNITELLTLSRELEIRKQISGDNQFIESLLNYLSCKYTNIESNKNEKQIKFILTSVRLLRNLCANMPNNQIKIISNQQFIDVSISLLTNFKYNESFIQVNNTQIKYILISTQQLLINSIVQNDITQSKLWSKLLLNNSNNILLLIENYREIDKFHLLPSNLMLVYNCILSSKSRMNEFINSRELVLSILELIKEDDSFDHDYNTELFNWIHLIFKSCFKNDHFVQLYKLVSNNGLNLSNQIVTSMKNITVSDDQVPSIETTAIPNNPDSETGKTNKIQIKLLNLLDSIINDGDQKNIKDYIDSDKSIIDVKTCFFIIDELASLYNLDFNRKSLDGSTQHLTTALCQYDFDAIFFFFKIFANITSYTDEMLNISLTKFKTQQHQDPTPLVITDDTSNNAIDPEAPKKFDLNTLLRKKGLVGLCIGSLHGNYGNDNSASSSIPPPATTKENETVTSKGFNRECESPDKGYKIELVRILGNLAYKNKSNQDEIRELGGIEIILNHCRFDVNNPFIKEWSVFAIRNLCEDNQENQKLINDLKIKGVANKEDLKDLGVDVDLTENGTVKFKTIPKK